MSGYIGSKASVVTPGAERKKVFSITTTTTSLTGLVYTPGFVHVFHNGVRLVDGTDYTATNGTSITLTTAAQNGDEVVVISYATFQVADAYTKAESDARYVNVTGDTMTGALIGTNLTLSGGVYLGGTGSANLLDDYEEGTWTPAIRGSGVAGSYSITSAAASYRKIGSLVVASLRIVGITGSGGTGYMQITGFPFTKADNGILSDSAARVRFVTGTFDYPTLEMITGASTNVAYVFCNQHNSGGFDLPIANVGSNTEISGHLIYFSETP